MYDHYHFDLPVIDLDRYINRGKSAGHLPEKTKQFLLTHAPENRLFKIVPLLQTDSLALVSLTGEDPYAKEIQLSLQVAKESKLNIDGSIHPNTQYQQEPSSVFTKEL